MDRPQILLDVLDEGLAFERWIEYGHTEECYEAAAHMDRVVEAQAEGAALDPELLVARTRLVACSLCRADLEEATELLRAFAADRQEGSVVPSTVSPAPTPAATSGGRGRSRRLAVAAAVVVACVAGITLLYLQRPRSPKRTAQPAADKPDLRRGGTSARRAAEPRSRPGGRNVVVPAVPPRTPQPVPPKRLTAPRIPDRRVRVPTPRVPMRPAPTYGILRIATRPWAKIYIDGRDYGLTPQPRIQLPAGRYKLVLHNPPLKIRQTIFIHIQAGQTLKIVRNLHAKTTASPPKGLKPGQGVLRINTIPPTQVYVDGRLRGTTPLLRLPLPAGRHELRLTNKRRGIDKRYFIRIRAGQPTTFIRKFK